MHYASFPGQDPEEEAILVLRRKKILLYSSIFFRFLTFMVVALAPLWYRYLVKLSPQIPSTIDKLGLGGWLWLLYSVALFAFAFRIFGGWWNWKNDLYIITDKRVVDYNWWFPFRRKNVTASLSKVQDSVARKQGIFAFLFGYGSLVIETAGSTSPFYWSGLPYPEEADKVLRDAVAAYQSRTKPESDSSGL